MLTGTAPRYWNESGFQLLSVSWPRPVHSSGDGWTGAPDWSAPLMPRLPTWHVRTIERRAFYVIDWREMFRDMLDEPGTPTLGTMRGFHVVFRLRPEASGVFTIFSTGGLVVRVNGCVEYERRVPQATRCRLALVVGDRVEVAHWHQTGDWLWATSRNPGSSDETPGIALFASYCREVEAALRKPNGPPLKIFTHAAQPFRCVLAIYSMVLNGYRPAGIYVYGEYQWSERCRYILRALLPFACVVGTAEVNRALERIDPRLPGTAHSLWAAMKICVSLCLQPYTYCFLDDDVFIVDRLDDALALHATHDLVYSPDEDCGRLYQSIWCKGRTGQVGTGDLNTGLYFMKAEEDARGCAERLLQVSPNGYIDWQWEQGFIACEFADKATVALSPRRYFAPQLDGLPGGILGYDWQENPCQFASIHFFGPRPKPDDRVACAIARDVLDRRRANAHG
jgi:hypothetical protein